MCDVVQTAKQHDAERIMQLKQAHKANQRELESQLAAANAQSDQHRKRADELAAANAKLIGACVRVCVRARAYHIYTHHTRTHTAWVS